MFASDANQNKSTVSVSCPAPLDCCPKHRSISLLILAIIFVPLSIVLCICFFLSSDFNLIPIGVVLFIVGIVSFWFAITQSLKKTIKARVTAIIVSMFFLSFYLFVAYDFISHREYDEFPVTRIAAVVASIIYLFAFLGSIIGGFKFVRILFIIGGILTIPPGIIVLFAARDLRKLTVQDNISTSTDPAQTDK